jgi:hypothetical protein
MSEFIAVDAGISTGLFLFWRNAAGMKYARLATEWEKVGLPSKLLPPEVSPSQALNRAMNDQECKVGGKKYFVKNIGRMAWHMVRQDSTVAGEPQYTPVLKGAIVAGVPVVSVVSDDPKVQDLAAKMVAGIAIAYEEHLTVFGAADLGIWLTKLVDHSMSATSVKKGGLYFVPARVEEMARKVDAAIDAASDTDSHLCFIPAMRTADVTRTVMEGLTTRVKGIMADIAEFVETNTDPQDRSVRLRQEELGAARAQITEFCGIFQVPLLAITSDLDALNNKLAGAKVTLAAHAEGREVVEGARVLELDDNVVTSDDSPGLEGTRKLELD